MGRRRPRRCKVGGAQQLIVQRVELQLDAQHVPGLLGMRLVPHQMITHDAWRHPRRCVCGRSAWQILGPSWIYHRTNRSAKMSDRSTDIRRGCSSPIQRRRNVSSSRMILRARAFEIAGATIKSCRILSSACSIAVAWSRCRRLVSATRRCWSWRAACCASASADRSSPYDSSTSKGSPWFGMIAGPLFPEIRFRKKRASLIALPDCTPALVWFRWINRFPSLLQQPQNVQHRRRESDHPFPH